MLTEKGNFILSRLYDSFRIKYLDRHPGVNENDVERAFLCAASNMVHGGNPTDIVELIETIR